MTGQHIYLDKESKDKVSQFACNNNLNFSKAVRYLITKGLSSINEELLLSKQKDLLEKIYSKQVYLRDLLEQLYSDMEIDKLSNPKDNKALQKFKSNKDKVKYDE